MSTYRSARSACGTTVTGACCPCSSKLTTSRCCRERDAIRSADLSGVPVLKMPDTFDLDTVCEALTLFGRILAVEDRAAQVIAGTQVARIEVLGVRGHHGSEAGRVEGRVDGARRIGAAIPFRSGRGEALHRPGVQHGGRRHETAMS